MKIYTKKGDNGSTQLIGGTRIKKNNERIDSYGTVDELNSYIGLLRDNISNNDIKKELILIQDRLFTIGALLASDPDKKGMNLPLIKEENITFLENSIDKMNEELPKMTHFILPGGHNTVSFCHIARCICRRAERLTVGLNQKTLQRDIIIKYLNRLSDYLFVLSRFTSNELNAEEILWKPSK
tara:strand:- start:1266 stop:1814 length:549 start_codon:yes stop_codon:yes gene_type:complete